MNSKIWTRIIALTLLAALAIPVQLAAQQKAKPHHRHQYHHYQIVDVGTFGGPQSWLFTTSAARIGLLNNQGTVAGSADTLAVDPYCIWAFYPDCSATHAFQWQNGGKTDLGVLPGGIGSQVIWISANGLLAGISDNGQQDPLNPALPQIHAVLWQHGEITDLGTLPEGGYESYALAINRRGEIAGEAYNTIPDPNSIFGYGYQSRAFYWKNGVMQDLGTLGTGTDAMAGLINERGQVVGWSYINSVPSALCAGFGLGFSLTTDSFIWDKKNGMTDIGSLGGTCTLGVDLNSRGQVVGGSALTGDTTTHPFVWNATTGVTDLLDPSDSNYGFAEAENAHGDVVGGTCDSVTCYALLWRNSGGKWQKSTLSTGTDNAFSISINASDQVLGNVGTNSSAPFLWEDGGPLVNLNTLVPPGSGLQLVEAHQIDDQGGIIVGAVDASGNNHAVLLIPCDEDHPGVDGCDYSMVDARTLQPSAAPATQRPTVGAPRGHMHAGMLDRLRSRLGQRTPGSVTDSASAAKQAFPAKTDGVDVEGGQLLGPLYGHYKGYCGVYSGKLTGYCTAYSYYSCLAKTSTACPSGPRATKPGYFQCSNRFSRYVDLARGCGFN
jgi:probable HAF family extracellular repeat protein